MSRSVRHTQRKNADDLRQKQTSIERDSLAYNAGLPVCQLQYHQYSRYRRQAHAREITTHEVFTTTARDLSLVRAASGAIYSLEPS